MRILFVGAIVFLIALSFLNYRRLTTLIELGQLVNRTTQLTLGPEKTLGSFKDTETGYFNSCTIKIDTREQELDYPL